MWCLTFLPLIEYLKVFVFEDFLFHYFVQSILFHYYELVQKFQRCCFTYSAFRRLVSINFVNDLFKIPLLSLYTHFIASQHCAISYNAIWRWCMWFCNQYCSYKSNRYIVVNLYMMAESQDRIDDNNNAFAALINVKVNMMISTNYVVFPWVRCVICWVWETPMTHGPWEPGHSELLPWPIWRIVPAVVKFRGRWLLWCAWVTGHVIPRVLGSFWVWARTMREGVA